MLRISEPVTVPGLDWSDQESVPAEAGTTVNPMVRLASRIAVRATHIILCIFFFIDLYSSSLLGYAYIFINKGIQIPRLYEDSIFGFFRWFNLHLSPLRVPAITSPPSNANMET
jgi:hypothetical protein